MHYQAPPVKHVPLSFDAIRSRIVLLSIFGSNIECVPIAEREKQSELLILDI
jgi:hypothetical protein